MTVINSQHRLNYLMQYVIRIALHSNKSTSDIWQDLDDLLDNIGLDEFELLKNTSHDKWTEQLKQRTIPNG